MITVDKRHATIASGMRGRRSSWETHPSAAPPRAGKSPSLTSARGMLRHAAPSPADRRAVPNACKRPGLRPLVLAATTRGNLGNARKFLLFFEKIEIKIYT